MVLRAPNAIVGVALLTQQAEPALAAVKIKLGLDAEQRPERDFIHYFKLQLFQDRLEAGAVFLLGRFDGFPDIGVDVQSLESLGGLLNGPVSDKAFQGNFHLLSLAVSVGSADVLDQGKVSGEVLSKFEKTIDGWGS